MISAIFGHSEHSTPTLQLWDVELSSLPALLAAATPPAGAPMRCLRLRGRWQLSPLAAAIPAGSAAAQQLAQLAELHMDLEEPDVALALLEALLPHIAHNLTHLDVRGGLGPSLPPAVAQLRGLRRLALPNNELADLPNGPYLESEFF